MTGSAASCNEAKLYVYFSRRAPPHLLVASADNRLARFCDFDSRGAFLMHFRAVAFRRFEFQFCHAVRREIHESSTSSHAHTSELRSSLGPEHILATSAGLVKVKLCVESFITIHIASLL